MRTMANLEERAGYGLDDIPITREGNVQRPHGGVTVHMDELGPLYNLLEDNPEEWNHRLRVVVAGMLLHYIREGKLEGGFTTTTRIVAPEASS